MIVVGAALLALLLAFLRGGRFERLGEVSFRYAPLIVLGLLIQILIFNPWIGPYLTLWQVVTAYNISMILVWATLALNWRVPGARLMALGVFLNWLAITANGGFMPASPDALKLAGLLDATALRMDEPHNNSVLAGENTRLWWLTDVMAVPAGLPFANVFSLGDVLLAAGIGWMIHRTMVRAEPDRRIKAPAA
jgi:hypothetical protein